MWPTKPIFVQPLIGGAPDQSPVMWPTKPIFVQPLIGGAPDQSPVMWPTKHVWKTCQEQFPYTAPIRHDLPRPFFASGKPFQPLLATCRKTSDFRHRRQHLIQTGSKTQPIVFLGKQKLTRSPFVC
jgi:hypothetical protein